MALLIVTLAVAGSLAAQCLRAAWTMPAAGWTARTVLLAGLLFTGLSLFRPHQHVFQGLDCSAYRLMTRAFVGGRGFHAPDGVLAAVPPPLRRGVLLSAGDEIRPTRDRSFQVMSLETCATQPYFYPTLPLAAAGLARLIGPPVAVDFFVPLLGWLAAAALLALGVARAGGSGGWLALALCLGSPLVSWTLRGYFAEAAGGALVALALAHAALPKRRLGFVEALACGLAVSFHPALMPLALPVAGLAALAAKVQPARAGSGIRDFLATVAGFALGLIPLVFFTAFVAQPYGGLGLQRQLAMVRGQPILAAVYALSVLLGLALLAASGVGRRGLAWFGRWEARGYLVARLVLPVGALLPGVVLATQWSHAAWVHKGAYALLRAVGRPFGLLLGGALLAASLRGALRGRLLACAVIAAAPFYLALKGFEPVGFWSLRRLCPLLLAVLPVALAALAAGVAVLRAGRWRMAAVAAATAACLWLPVRVPEAYAMREEQGADAALAALAGELRGRLVLCDYYPHSVPLAFEPGLRAVGANRTADWGALAAWIQAQQTSGVAVAWLTSYAPPGLELGVRLTPRASVGMQLPRLAAPRDRLAAAQTWRMRATVLAAESAQTGDPPALDKTFDGGPMALRGAWDWRVEPVAGARPAGQWSRAGCAWVGPVPQPGQAVRLWLTGSIAPRGTACVLQVRAPWGGEPVRLVFDSTGVTTNALDWLRPPDDCADLTATAVYWIDDVADAAGPARVLLHRVRMEAPPPEGVGQ